MTDFAFLKQLKKAHFPVLDNPCQNTEKIGFILVMIYSAVNGNNAI